MSVFVNSIFSLAMLGFYTSCSTAIKPSAHTIGDVAEVFPEWIQASLYDSASQKLCHGLAYTDYGFLVSNGDYISAGASLIDSPDRWGEWGSSCVDEITYSILAWQSREIGDSIRIKNALIWCRWDGTAPRSDKVGVSRWALMVLSKTEGVYKSTWRVVGGEQGLRRYGHSPTNKEIYSFLAHIGKMESQMFTPNPYDWNGISVVFVDGDVLDETWEAVIGEKPTKFFPNGK